METGPSDFADVVIGLTRGARGLQSTEDVRAHASKLLGDDAPISVALRDKRIVSGEWGMQPDNGEGDRTLSGTLAILYAMDKETMHRLSAHGGNNSTDSGGKSMDQMVREAAQKTLQTLVNDSDVQKAVKAAQEDAQQSPTAARVAALYRCALQSMNPSNGNPLNALVCLTELYSTLATLAEMRRGMMLEVQV